MLPPLPWEHSQRDFRHKLCPRYAWTACAAAAPVSRTLADRLSSNGATARSLRPHTVGEHVYNDLRVSPFAMASTKPMLKLKAN